MAPMDRVVRVAIIGAGPAGSLCAIALLRRATDLGRAVAVSLFDRKRFCAFGPRGCNLCAGVISETLIRNLESLGVLIPPSLIQDRIRAYRLETRVGSLRIERPSRSVIYTVYRGMGPVGLEYDEARSFDHFLLRTAERLGAVHVPRLVAEVTRPAGAFLLTCDRGEQHEADVLVGAFGVNSTMGRRLRQFGLRYRPPRTLFACQAEIPLDEAFIRREYGGEIRVFNLGLPRIRFASLTPKRRHVTVTIVGRRVRGEDLAGFLGHPAVRRAFPGDWAPAAAYCQCYPRLPATAAGNPYGERLVIIGDADISRYMKDGLGSAFHTASLAAEAILAGGMRADFRRRYHRPSRQRFSLDNWAGKALFLGNDLAARVPLLAAAILRLARWEQARFPAGRRPLNEGLWYLFTGDGPYRATLRRILRPRFCARLLLEIVRAILHRTGNAPAPRATAA